MRTLYAFLALFLFVGVACADPRFPAAIDGQRVYDGANLLPVATESQLQQEITDYERATSIQMAVVTVPSLDGLDVMDYAQQLGRRWGVGDRARNNGVLMLYAPTEGSTGKMAIAVGYGLEGDLPDAECDRIRRHVLHPLWVDGHRTEAVVAVVHAVRERMGPTAYTQRAHTHPDQWTAGQVVLLIIVILVFLLVISWAASKGGPSGRYGSTYSYSSSGGSSGGGFGGGSFGGGGSSGSC